jgi:predicted RND superfamily exporter protein
MIILRSARHAAYVVASLCVGTLWFVGTLGLLRLKLNFVNFAVLPITFGIGIDYAVNLYQRYRQLGVGGAAKALSSSGGAIALCSATTILGYSALLVADNRAIFSFGLAAVIGEVSCLSAALVVLPTLLILRDRRLIPRSTPAAVSSPELRDIGVK